MIEVSLTQFIDFLGKSGTPKLTAVRDIWRQKHEQYDPRTDFYKPLREGIVKFHRSSHPKEELDRLLLGVRDPRKLDVYSSMLAGYKKFLGNGSNAWVEPPRAAWSHGELIVKLNPEVGLLRDRQQFAVKLYLRTEKLVRERARIINHLMRSRLMIGLDSPLVGVLDVARGKLHDVPTDTRDIEPLLRGEALSFIEMYSSF